MEREFSVRTREQAVERLQHEAFDLLIIGGGITGAAVARDATSRGLKVALVEKNDFAFGTSSRSSKLIHGGLRYLENLEFGLVFESLTERALLLKTVPNWVRPLPFYLPVYKGEPKGRGILGLGLWLYDLLALFRTPGFHRSLSRKQLLEHIPFLKAEGLTGGFRYYDASMWDDVLAVETLRCASQGGAAIANYVEAIAPIWHGETITGFEVRDVIADRKLKVHALRTVVCAGPWTDEIGGRLSKDWTPWLNPSKGVHIIFDLKRIPIPGAMVMSHPEDGRISFVIPRPDYGAGVVIVGTTDGPTPKNPDLAEITHDDVDYLLKLLNKYFPDLKLTVADVLSAYIGVRPLVGGSGMLQKVSREHHIDRGPGGTVVVAGGKYTTHRKMAEEIVDFTLDLWKKGASLPPHLRAPDTRTAANPAATQEAVTSYRAELKAQNTMVPEELLSRYGSEAREVSKINKIGINTGRIDPTADPEGFPYLEAQLRYSMRAQMVMHLEDFYLRRTALFASRMDRGMPWAKRLAEVWAEERGLGNAEANQELERLGVELARRSSWKEAYK